MHSATFTLPFVTLAFAAIACARSEDISSQVATLNDYCQARAQTECSQKLVTSCKVKDVSTCVTARAAECMKDVPQGTTYVASAGPACVEAVASAYATTTLTANGLDAVTTACEPIFSGPGAARAPCTVDYDCSLADGLRCLIPWGESSGKCMQPNLIEAGGACPGEADVCTGTYYCDPKSKVCTAEGGEGSSCSPYYQPCMKGYTCPGNGLFGAQCQPLKAAGDACTAGADCASNLCDKATGQSQGTCADQIQLTALDSLCAPYQ
jgi:hypothetical protein